MYCTAAVHTRLTIGSDGTVRRARRGGGQGREEGRRGGGGSRKKMRREMKGNKFPRPDQEFRGGGMVLSCAPRLDDDISA